MQGWERELSHAWKSASRNGVDAIFLAQRAKDMELLDFAIQSRTMVIHLSDNVLSVLSVVTADMIQQALCHIHSMVLSTTESSSEYLSHRGDCD